MEAHPTGFVIWLTGMHGAGKTALASHLARRFSAVGRPVELLDGDDPGEILTRGLGVTKDDRDTAVKRLAYVAKLLARNGAVVIVAALSPDRGARDAVRRDVRRFVEIFVDCPMDKLLERDSDGLYKRALAGEVKNVSGIDDPYEPPTHAELVVHSHEERTEAAAVRALQALVDLKYIGPAEFERLTGGLRARRPKRQRPAGAELRLGRRKRPPQAAGTLRKRAASRRPRAARRSGR